MESIKRYQESTFEDIKHINEFGNEYWEARELQSVLEYTQWRNFVLVINKAKEACENSKNNASDHFADVSKMINLGKGAKKKVNDYRLSRYACYLIVQNGDSRKEIIALGQTYFAIQTRKQELSEIDYNLLPEDEKRFYVRKQTKDGNYSLQKAAKKAGVKNMDQFHNAGYQGLYNEETADDIAKRKNLRYREDILDNMGSTELAANLFRITQAEDKLINEKIKGEKNAKIAHHKVGKIVRKAIKETGGTMPEKLPTPNKSLKELEKEKRKIKIANK
ncbi:MAG: DNA damage-inducible protein D [Bacilli bacterium]|nr:DNA damage-inducible protein D [Bacilli bacterium]MDD4795770.1 DNA damage-inducible protein D [Bacilli bacterium]